jgi:gamma-tubulin complex component 2
VYLDGQDPSFIAETSFVKAPLNSRVASNSYNNVPRSRGKGKSLEVELGHLPIEIQEAMILEDLLFVLMVSTSFPAVPFILHKAVGD